MQTGSQISHCDAGVQTSPRKLDSCHPSRAPTPKPAMARNEQSHEFKISWQRTPPGVDQNSVGRTAFASAFGGNILSTPREENAKGLSVLTVPVPVKNESHTSSARTQSVTSSSLSPRCDQQGLRLSRSSDHQCIHSTSVLELPEIRSLSPDQLNAPSTSPESSYSSYTPSVSYASDSDSVEIIDHLSTSESPPSVTFRRPSKRGAHPKLDEVKDPNLDLDLKADEEVCFKAGCYAQFLALLRDRFQPFMDRSRYPTRDALRKPAIHRVLKGGSTNLLFSGAEGTLIESLELPSNVVWGLQNGEMDTGPPHVTARPHFSFTQLHHRSHSIDGVRARRALPPAVVDPNPVEELNLTHAKPFQQLSSRHRHTKSAPVPPAAAMHGNPSLDPENEREIYLNGASSQHPALHASRNGLPSAMRLHGQTRQPSFHPRLDWIDLRSPPTLKPSGVSLNQAGVSPEMFSALQPSLLKQQAEYIPRHQLLTPPSSTSPLWKPAFSPGPVRLSGPDKDSVTLKSLNAASSSPVAHDAGYRPRMVDQGGLELVNMLNQLRLSSAMICQSMRPPRSPLTPSPRYVPTRGIDLAALPVSFPSIATPPQDLASRFPVSELRQTLPPMQGELPSRPSDSPNWRTLPTSGKRWPSNPLRPRKALLTTVPEEELSVTYSQSEPAIISQNHLSSESPMIRQVQTIEDTSLHGPSDNKAVIRVNIPGNRAKTSVSTAPNVKRKK